MYVNVIYIYWYIYIYLASPISQPNTYVESPKCCFFWGGYHTYIYIYGIYMEYTLGPGTLNGWLDRSITRIEGRLDFTDTSSVAAQGLGLFGVKLRAVCRACVALWCDSSWFHFLKYIWYKLGCGQCTTMYNMCAACIWKIDEDCIYAGNLQVHCMLLECIPTLRLIGMFLAHSSLLGRRDIRQGFGETIQKFSETARPGIRSFFRCFSMVLRPP